MITIDEFKGKLRNQAINHYLSEVVDNYCKYWNEKTARYFQWHFENHKT
jgi:hypothetical protein